MRRGRPGGLLSLLAHIRWSEQQEHIRSLISVAGLQSGFLRSLSATSFRRGGPVCRNLSLESHHKRLRWGRPGISRPAPPYEIVIQSPGGAESSTAGSGAGGVVLPLPGHPDFKVIKS